MNKESLREHRHYNFTTTGIVPNFGWNSDYDGYPIIVFNPVTDYEKYKIHACKFGPITIESFANSILFLTKKYRATQEFKDFTKKKYLNENTDNYEKFNIILDFTNLNKCSVLEGNFDIEPSEIFSFRVLQFLYSTYTNIEFIPIFPDWMYEEDNNKFYLCFEDVQDIKKHEDYFGASLFKIWHLQTHNSSIHDIWSMEGIWDRLRREIFESYSLKKGWMEVLEWVFGEILDNSYTHGGANNIFFQILRNPSNGYVELFVFDDGHGFLSSFKNSIHHRTLRTESDAITLALKEGVTSNEKNNAGWGLYGTSQIVQNTLGQLNIQSGNQKIFLDKNNLFIKDLKRHTILPVPTRKGASVEVVLPVNIAEVVPSDVAGFNPTSTFWDKYEHNQNLENINFNNSANFYAHEEFQGFGSRVSGKIAYNIITNLLNNYDELTIDFSRIPVVSASFSDECFAKLSNEHSLKNKLFSDESSININLNYHTNEKKIKIINMEPFVKNVLQNTIQKRMSKRD